MSNSRVYHVAHAGSDGSMQCRMPTSPSWNRQLLGKSVQPEIKGGADWAKAVDCTCSERAVSSTDGPLRQPPEDP